MRSLLQSIISLSTLVIVNTISKHRQFTGHAPEAWNCTRTRLEALRLLSLDKKRQPLDKEFRSAVSVKFEIYLSGPDSAIGRKLVNISLIHLLCSAHPR